MEYIFLFFKKELEYIKERKNKSYNLVVKELYFIF